MQIYICDTFYVLKNPLNLYNYYKIVILITKQNLVNTKYFIFIQISKIIHVDYIKPYPPRILILVFK